MEAVISIFKGIKSVISIKEKPYRYNPPIDSRKILWSIVPQFIYNIKENKLITNFNDPLWVDKEHNAINNVNVYNVENEYIRQELIKKINKSTFTIVYEFGEKEWKFLCSEDFKNHPKNNSFLKYLHKFLKK